MVKTLTGKTFTLEVEDISRNSDRTPGTAGSTEEEAGAGTASSGGTGDGYFQSYEDFDVHRIMLEDTVRTKAYEDAILGAGEVFKDKVVMDVGAGTGILSLFCAKAGAKRVYAVEASSLAKVLPKVAEINGYAETIKVIHSRVEDVKLRVEEKVDIIVSEWMGFYLLHEAMLDSVLFARDNFLNPVGGLLFPNTAQIFAAPCKLPEEKFSFWNKPQYSFDFSPFAEVSRQFKEKPEVVQLSGDDLLSDPQLLWTLDLMKVTSKDLEILKDRRFFSIEEDGEMGGVCIWFDCAFPTRTPDDDFLTLSTAPWSPETHWKQTVILFGSSTAVEGGDIIGWEFSMEKSSPSSRAYKLNFRSLDADTEEHPVPCKCGSVKCAIVSHFMETHPSTQATSEEAEDNSTTQQTS